MESRPDTSAMGNEDSLAIIPVDQGDLGQNYDDVMARRLKNRERQRRYRARKRLEADTKSVHNANNSAPSQRQVEVNWALNDCENRILCRRKWKQDARRVHVAKQQEIITNGPGNESQSRVFGAGVGLLIQCENNLDNIVNKDEMERKVVPSRRHWKADARNKKD